MIEIKQFFKFINNIQTTVVLGAKTIPQVNKDEILDMMKTLNSFLEETKFIAGDHLTIADLSTLASLSSSVVS